jgi:hypothetical protein
VGRNKKLFLFIWVFEYTLVSVGKGVPALFFFLIRGCFFLFCFLGKKTENCNFCAVLGFWKNVVVSLVWKSKVVVTFFRWARLVPPYFKHFFVEFWFAAV